MVVSLSDSETIEDTNEFEELMSVEHVFAFVDSDDVRL